MTRWPITLLICVVAGCLPATPTPNPATGTLQVEVVAGPVCPVEQEPPDPNCEPRPVEGARIFVQPGDGRDIVVAEAATDPRGRATIEIAGGDYLVIGREVEGLMGRPDLTTVTVSAGQAVTITLTYDTGIR
jgi:hypothetical protein